MLGIGSAIKMGRAGLRGRMQAPARRAATEAMQGVRRQGAGRVAAANRMRGGRPMATRIDMGSHALTQGLYTGARRSVASQTRRAGDAAYDARFAMTKRRYRNSAIGGGLYLGSMQLSNGRGKTAANQNTFATRRMRNQSVGISSGALQTFEAYNRSIGGVR